MKKTARLYYRCATERKKEVQAYAKSQKMTVSAYLDRLIDGDMPHLTHEHQIQNALKGNQLINELLTNSQVPLHTKQLIGKEMKKYV